MAEEVPASDETKARRRPLLLKRVTAMRKSNAQRAAWDRRRAELRVFLEDDAPNTDMTESAGSPDHELDELSDMMR